MSGVGAAPLTPPNCLDGAARRSSMPAADARAGPRTPTCAAPGVGVSPALTAEFLVLVGARRVCAVRVPLPKIRSHLLCSAGAGGLGVVEGRVNMKILLLTRASQLTPAQYSRYPPDQQRHTEHSRHRRRRPSAACPLISYTGSVHTVCAPLVVEHEPAAHRRRGTDWAGTSAPPPR